MANPTLTHELLFDGLSHITLPVIQSLVDDFDVAVPPLLFALGINMHGITGELKKGPLIRIEKHHLTVGDHFEIGKQGVLDKALQV